MGDPNCASGQRRLSPSFHPAGRTVLKTLGHHRRLVVASRIRISASVVGSWMAANSGLVAASLLQSVQSNAGAGNTLPLAVGAAVIGGTSLFGGRASTGESDPRLKGALGGRDHIDQLVRCRSHCLLHPGKTQVKRHAVAGNIREAPPCMRWRGSRGSIVAALADCSIFAASRRQSPARRTNREPLATRCSRCRRSTPDRAAVTGDVQRCLVPQAL
jgi:hypothetical protein